MNAICYIIFKIISIQGKKRMIFLDITCLLHPPTFPLQAGVFQRPVTGWVKSHRNTGTIQSSSLQPSKTSRSYI